MSDLTSTPSTEAPGADPRVLGELDPTSADRVGLPGVQGAELNATRAEGVEPAEHEFDTPPEPDYITFVGVDLNEKYRIIRPIGKGGMGTIFLAEHVGIGKRVAIKLLGSKFSGNDAIIRRFEKEARSAARVRHKNIVEIYDCDRTPEGLPFFAMELLNGIDIRRMLKRDGPIPWPRALHFMKQICAALEAAHKVGVVHRDMKPGNVFVVEDVDEPDTVKVVDFGIAKVLDNDEDQELTHTGMVMGTAHYMSPEQARSEPLDHRADVYSAGVILFQMLTGKLPYVGKGFMGTLSLHLTEPVPSIRAVAIGEGIDLPLSLEAIIQKVLAKDPEERYQSAAEFAEALDELGANPKTSLTQTMSFQAAELRKKIRPTWIAAGIAAIVVLALTTGYMMMQGPRDEGAKVDAPVVAKAPAKASAEDAPPPADASAVEPESAGAPESAGPEDDATATAGETPPEPSGETAAESAGEDVEAVDSAGDDDAEPTTDPEASSKKKSKKRGTKKKVSKTPKEDKATSLPERPARQKGISSVSATVAACKSKGWFPGQSIKVKISVSPAGDVTSATAKGPIAGTPLARCVEKAVRGASFEKSAKGDSFLHTFRG